MTGVCIESGNLDSEMDTKGKCCEGTHGEDHVKTEDWGNIFTSQKNKKKIKKPKPANKLLEVRKK